MKKMKKVIIWIIYFSAWIIHAEVLRSAGMGPFTWRFWLATLAMAVACIFLPNNWD